MNRPALQIKQVRVSRMAFRARKVFGTFEKRAPGGNNFISHLDEGDMGEPQHRNTAKKFNAHRITARKIDETPSPQQLFLTSTLNVILLYLNNFPQNKHTIAELALISSSGALFAVVMQLQKPKPNPA